MARNVAVVVTDDIDGTPDAETVTFGFDGATYEIDLGEENRGKLEDAIAPFIEAGRRITRPRAKAAPAGRVAPPKVDRAVVRAWAKESGLAVSERGRISAEILQKYEATH